MLHSAELKNVPALSVDRWLRWWHEPKLVDLKAYWCNLKTLQGKYGNVNRTQQLAAEQRFTWLNFLADLLFDPCPKPRCISAAVPFQCMRADTQNIYLLLSSFFVIFNGNSSSDAWLLLTILHPLQSTSQV